MLQCQRQNGEQLLPAIQNSQPFGRGQIRIEFESSYEPTGPFGAKSIGELVINTPAPAIMNALYNATGCFFDTLPVRSEDIFFAMKEKK